MSETRKLAAILVADVVGYSRLVGVDEDRTLARLRGLRSDLIDPAIAAYHGRIVKRTGDGSMVEFRSVVDAVRCAIEVQTGLIERNAGVPPDRRIEFRVGVHLGDVVEESDGDLMGDGVNIAARLEGIAKPGAICLSEDAYRQVRGRLEMTVSDLGPTELKNITEPIRVYSLEVGQPAQARTTAAATAAVKPGIAATPKTSRWYSGWRALAAALALALIAAGAYAWHAGYAPRPPGASVVDDRLKTAARMSIVVLPFENSSGDPEQQYFADAVTDDLTTDLSHLPDSFVIARDTAFTYKGRQVDAKALGRELGVRYVLEGSVRRAGEKIEINAQLISTETGAGVWADRFQGDRSNLGKLQFEVVARLANSLGVELMKAEVLRAARERPGDANARDLTMRGWAILWNFNSANKSTWNDAIAMFERAIALDPKDARAMTGLATALFARPYAGWSDDPSGDLARADKMADAALALRPDDSEAHFLKALLLERKSQWRQAIAEAETAIADDPNNARAIAQASFYRMFLGHAEDGVVGQETALRLSPHDPMSPIWQVHLCYLHNHLAQWEQAIEWCEKALANNVKERGGALAGLAVADAWAGHDKEAREAVSELRKVDPSFTLQTVAGYHDQSDDRTFDAQSARIVEGLRKAGVPEGEMKAN
ncbi:MAG TPA: adenylate/guanylate cyclase domain-containing protein [Roseiarcus sp.]|jgi:class 3 adenylate cyclase/TolB-like protein/Flp pilus assembly protein TadD